MPVTDPKIYTQPGYVCHRYWDTHNPAIPATDPGRCTAQPGLFPRPQDRHIARSVLPRGAREHNMAGYSA